MFTFRSKPITITSHEKCIYSVRQFFRQETSPCWKSIQYTADNNSLKYSVNVCCRKTLVTKSFHKKYSLTAEYVIYMHINLKIILDPYSQQLSMGKIDRFFICNTCRPVCTAICKYTMQIVIPTTLLINRNKKSAHLTTAERCTPTN